jgi:hypothetical protein
MKFSPRLIVVETGHGLADALEAMDYWLIRVEASAQDQARAYDRALSAVADALHKDPVAAGEGQSGRLGLGLGSRLEQGRPFMPNKATEPAASVTGFVARAAAELLAVDVILHGHDRVRQGPHCVVLASTAFAQANAADPHKPAAAWKPGQHTAEGVTVGVCCIQPDSGSGECFDLPCKSHAQSMSPADLWSEPIRTRLLELMEHWSFHPGRPTARG